MDIKKAIELARSMSEEEKPPIPASQPRAELSSPSIGEESRSNANSLVPQSPEVAEALKIITAIASGHDPYTEDRSTLYRPEYNPETTRALCVVVGHLLGVHMAARTSASVPPSDLPPGTRRPLEDYLKQVEKAVILEALEETHWNRTEAARRLGITFRALRYKLESLGIDA